jgi:acetyltransferase
MSTLKELTPAMLAQFTQIDYERDMALVAILTEGASEREIGVCRYVLNPDGASCEFAIVVAEAWHGRGLGRHLMTRLIAIARERGIERMTGQVLVANRGMLDLMAKLGFTLTASRDAPELKEATLILSGTR